MKRCVEVDVRYVHQGMLRRFRDTALVVSHTPLPAPHQNGNTPSQPKRTPVHETLMPLKLA
ncbi:hypothetical protein JAAARDRAFT_42837 [Jaapia argillacea MUCL 33604]|uniref:Uncharacterized protein n=1 Tax=Jaapia argillacea MUCL 33604 TaxID=933084 RepID=A0A067P3N3_9AGAM|nr:hypothetical protein JAAARDRAFT_42837 [Jaapia argillacea MUCL 33604]